MLIYSYCTCADTTISQSKSQEFPPVGCENRGHRKFPIDAIETTTGPLGQGISNAVGFAMAEEILRARFGKKVVDHHTYVIAGEVFDGRRQPRGDWPCWSSRIVKIDRSLGQQQHHH